MSTLIIKVATSHDCRVNFVSHKPDITHGITNSLVPVCVQQTAPCSRCVADYIQCPVVCKLQSAWCVPNAVVCILKASATG